MTTIGTAVLQIIPSLKGVTAEIEKQLDGKTIEVPVQPKVDQSAAKKAGKDAGEAITKPITEAAKKAGTDAGKAIDAEITKATKDTGTKVGKTVNESISQTAKSSGGLKQAAIDAAKEFEKGLVSGVASGVTSAMSGGRLGALMTDTLTGGIKDSVANSKIGTVLGAQVTDKLVEGVAGALKDSSIGRTITGAIDGIGSNLAGPVNGIVGALNPLKTAISGFQDGDLTGGLQNAATVLKSLETIGIPPEIAGGLQDIADAGSSNLETASGNLDLLKTSLGSLGDAAPGLKGKIEPLIAMLGELSAPVAVAAIAEKPAHDLDQWVHDNMGAFGRWFEEHNPSELGKQARDWVNRAFSDRPPGFPVTVELSTEEADRRMRAFLDQWSSAIINPKVNVPGQGTPATNPLATFAPTAPSSPPPARNPLDVFSPTARRPGQHAFGGSITGPGGPKSDAIPIWASNGEHMLPVDEVNALGGQAGVYRMRALIRAGLFGKFAGGGAIEPPDVAAAQALAGTNYSQGARTDCSGMVARVIDRTLGMPEAGLMSTKTATEWLAARGFIPGSGGPGQISVGWYDHGPNPNDGHMAMTLSDGRNAEAGGSNGVFTIGAGAKGANSPGFDHHMFLPTVYGEGPAGSSSGSAAPAGGSGGAAPASSGGGSSAPSSGGGGSINLPSSLSGFGAFAGEQLGNQLGDPKLGKLTSAAGSLIDGQVASALDVFGIPGSPGWLKGISTLIGGISIGGGSANPLAASPGGAGVPAPGEAENLHGTRAGQQPGVTYNITARDTEDAFVKAQRVEREKAAAKLDRF